MAVYYNGPPVDGGLYALYGTAIFILVLGILSDESSLRNPAPPGRLTQIVISPTVGVRLGEVGSLSIAIEVQSARVWVMCGRVGSCACTTGVLSPPRGSIVLFEDRVFIPLDTGVTP